MACVTQTWSNTVIALLSLQFKCINLFIPHIHFILIAFFLFVFFSFLASLLARNLHPQQTDWSAVQTG